MSTEPEELIVKSICVNDFRLIVSAYDLTLPIRLKRLVSMASFEPTRLIIPALQIHDRRYSHAVLLRLAAEH